MYKFYIHFTILTVVSFKTFKRVIILLGFWKAHYYLKSTYLPTENCRRSAVEIAIVWGLIFLTKTLSKVRFIRNNRVLYNSCFIKH